MKFTRQDIIEIAKKLRIWGKADSDFPKESSPVETDDVAIIRQTDSGSYVNRRVNLKEAVKAFAPGGGGGGIDDAEVTEVVTGDTSDASVELVDNVLKFQFMLEKGEKGDKGDPGEPGKDGSDGRPGTPPNYTAFAFYRGNTQPSTPRSTSLPPFMDNGNSWVEIPDNTGIWWMSVGEVVGSTNTVSKWSTPIKATGEDGVASDYYNFKYGVSTSVSEPPAVDETNSDPGPDWSDEVPSLISGQFMWMIIGKFKDGTLEGEWSTPIRLTGEQGMQGIPGEDGKSIEYIFTVTKEYTAPDTPVGENTDDFEPEGWTDDPTGPSAESPYEWTSKRVKAGNVWGVYSAPSLWSKYSFDGAPGEDGKDGPGVEYIYTRTESEDREELPAVPPKETPYDDPPEPWTDDPVGVDYTHRYEWVSKRTSDSEGVWGEFSTPSIWARYSYDGSDGEPGATAQLRYTKTSSASTVPPFEPMNVNPGSAWSTTKPDTTGDEAAWSISGSIRSNNTMVEPGWQGPFLMTGTPGATPSLPDYNFTVYTEGTLMPDPPTNIHPEYYTRETDWKIVPTSSSGTWWQCVGIVTGKTKLIREWGEVVPLNGKDGTAQDGKMSEIRWAKNDSWTVAPDIDKTKRNPSTGSVTWSTQQPIVNEDEYLWMTSGIVNPDNTSMAQNWSDPTCVTIPGPKGDVGPAGQEGAIGPQGVSGIPGVSIEVRWSLGTYDSPVASAPSGGERNPSGWSLTLPDITSTYKYVWFIQARIKDYDPDDPDSEGVVEGTWQGPTRSTGLEGADGVNGVNGDWTSYVFKLSVEEPDRPTSTEPVPPSSTGWLDGPDDTEPSEGQLWWMSKALIKGNTGKVSSEGWTRPIAVTGKPGTDGADGSGYTYRFAIWDSNTERPPIDVTNKENPGSDWLTSASPTSEKPYVWMTYAIIQGGQVVSDWYNPFCVTGEAGGQGPKGEKGQVIYPMGIYQKDITYVTDDDKAPYVYDTADGNYYVLNTSSWLGTNQPDATSTPSGDVEAGNRNWIKFEAFEAVLTKMLVTPNALIGSAVFNGDYMFSQQGIDPDTDSTSTHYECFNHEEPGASLPGCSYKFLPNVMINYKTGAGHLAAGKIKFDADGTITANDLTLQNMLTTTGAKLGSVVFNGDWMISQYGKDSSGTASTDYENFEPDNPTGGAFVPNIAFNFSTGAGFLAGGKIKFNQDGSTTLDKVVLSGGVNRQFKRISGFKIDSLYAEIRDVPGLKDSYYFDFSDAELPIVAGWYEGIIYNGGSSSLWAPDSFDLTTVAGEELNVRSIAIRPGGQLRYKYNPSYKPSGAGAAYAKWIIDNPEDFDIGYTTALAGNLDLVSRIPYIGTPDPPLVKFAYEHPAGAQGSDQGTIKWQAGPAVVYTTTSGVTTADSVSISFSLGEIPPSLKGVIVSAVGCNVSKSVNGAGVVVGLGTSIVYPGSAGLSLISLTLHAVNGTSFTQDKTAIQVIVYGVYEDLDI